MKELLISLCLAAAPEICVERWAPDAPCEAPAAEAFAAARAGVVLAEWRCGAAPAPLAVTEIAPGVFAHAGLYEEPDARNRGDVSNMGFVIGEQAVAVIDAGGSRAMGEALLAAIRAETDLPVDWLILTHMHPDHVFGASVFAEAGARVIGHRRLEAALANRAEGYLVNYGALLGAREAVGVRLRAPDEAVADRREIDLGGRVLTLTAHGTAHTDNDLSVMDGATGTLFAGDLVFLGHTPAVDGSILGWLKELDRLAADGAARVAPGHGPASAPWPEGAAPTRGYLAALVAETRAAVAAGASLVDAIGGLGESQRGDWALFDLFNPRNATAAFRELEWE